MASNTQQAWNDSMPRRKPVSWSKPKLTPQQRAEIKQRLEDGEEAQVLALEYGVSRATVERYR